MTKVEATCSVCDDKFTIQTQEEAWQTDYWKYGYATESKRIHFCPPCKEKFGDFQIRLNNAFSDFKGQACEAMIKAIKANINTPQEELEATLGPLTTDFKTLIAMVGLLQ